MTTRPRIRLHGHGDQAARVRRWLLESGADPVVGGQDVAAVVVTDADAPVDAAGVPVLDATQATWEEVAAFVREVAGRPAHTFDDHGSPSAWPRGSY